MGGTAVEVVLPVAIGSATLGLIGVASLHQPFLSKQGP